jgi:serpin B
LVGVKALLRKAGMERGVEAVAGLSSEVDGPGSAFGAFACEMARVVAGGSGNFVISPHNVASVLARLLLGARGETARELAACLGFGGQAEALGAIESLEGLLAGEARSAARGSDLKLSFANAFWFQQGLVLEPKFVGRLSKDEVFETDFASDPRGALYAINAWAREMTHGRIREIVSSGHIRRNTSLVLASAAYLKAGWQDKFDEHETRPRPFRRGDGSEVTVPMMWKPLPLA